MPVPLSDNHARIKFSAYHPAGTWITTPNGPVPIEDIAKERMIGLNVFSGQGGETNVTRIVAVKSAVGRPAVRVVLANGAYLEATREHLIWSALLRDSVWGWTPVAQLTSRHLVYLALDTTVTCPSDERAIAESTLVGWIHGRSLDIACRLPSDYEDDKRIEIIVANDEERAFVHDLIATTFPKVNFFTCTDSSGLGRVVIADEAIRPFVRKYNLNARPYHYAVPVAILRAGGQAQLAYINSLLKCNNAFSSYQDREQLIRHSANKDILAAMSKQLAHGVQALLLNLGIYAIVRGRRESKLNWHYVWRVTVPDATAWGRLHERMKSLPDIKPANSKHVHTARHRARGYPALVLRIESYAPQSLYGIQTESGTYLCGNALFCNGGHIALNHFPAPRFHKIACRHSINQ